MKWKARIAEQAAPARTALTSSRAKEKIIRALRKKA